MNRIHFPPLRSRLNRLVITTAFAVGLAAHGQAALTATQQRIETELSTITAGAATLDSSQVPPKRFPTNSELAEANALAITQAITDGVDSTYPAESLTAAAVSFDKDAAPIIAKEAVAANTTRAANIVTAVFSNSSFVSAHSDRPAVASAIAANAVCGVLDSNLDPTTERTRVREVTVAAIAAAYAQRSLTAGRPVIDVVKGSKADKEDGVVNKKAGATLTAGVTTGLVAQVSNTGDYDSNALLNAIVKAAVQSAPKHSGQIAQAAATAAAYVSGNADLFKGLGGGQKIANAAIKGLGSNPSSSAINEIQSAVNFGIKQAKLALEAVANSDPNGGGKFGAGAAGVSNYAHFNCTGPAVTDVSGF